ncbi:RidA family protein [Pseudomonas silesiensis]|jgi:enamine deaminase RidA (YjgF/YER057c/UK114 family)|uniref:RidA family protein n=1 Tax=Pseudomonas silesiensis TaxID=1853130 RepID=UPI003F777067
MPRSSFNPALAASLGIFMLLAQANASEVIRHKIPGTDFPVALAIEIPPNATLVNFSGAVPSVIHADQAKTSVAAYGDTQAQTVNVLQGIEQSLKSLGMDMRDVVKMQVYLVGDPAKQGHMDFAGFMKGYTRFFGTAQQPLLPTRSVFQVAGLANPGYLVEIEVTAVRP